jgi:hypothetical protein
VVVPPTLTLLVVWVGLGFVTATALPGTIALSVVVALGVAGSLS